MNFKIATDSQDIKTCYKLRDLIFIKEQNVPLERERDAEDDFAVHFLFII